jgi:hypothetical protein
MALLVPTRQKFVDLAPGMILGVTEVTLQSGSDTVTVPAPAHATANAAVGRVIPAGQAACTATQSGNTVTLAGTAGQKVIVCTLHSFTNSGAEA